VSDAIKCGDLLAARQWIKRARIARIEHNLALAASCLNAAGAYTREVSHSHA
jgi:hypothetical protein